VIQKADLENAESLDQAKPAPAYRRTKTAKFHSFLRAFNGMPIAAVSYFWILFQILGYRPQKGGAETSAAPFKSHKLALLY